VLFLATVVAGIKAVRTFVRTAHPVVAAS
jgi:hypothetical protein